jgi:mRNA interferase MazF
LRFPHTLEILPSDLNGLHSPSAALVFQIQAIDKKRLQRKLGDLSPESVQQIDTMIKHMLSL